MWLVILCVALTAVVLYRYLHSKQYPPRFPPGPRHFVPYIGDPIFALGKDIIAGFQEMHKKFGPIVGVNFGGRKVVSFNDLDMLQKLLVQDVFSGRPSQEGFNFLRQGQMEDGSAPGLLSSTGNNWKDMRRFSLQTLRDFGFGKRSMEDLIEDEFSHLEQKLESMKGEPVETMDLFNIPILNALMRIITGQRLDGTDPKMTAVMTKIEAFIADSGSSLSFLGFTFKNLLFLFEAFGMMRIIECMNSIFKIADHEATFDESSFRDFLDCFIDKKILKSDSSEDRKLAKHNLRNIILDLFLAGSETTSSTLKWAVLHLALNPDVQAKVQRELDDVLSENHGRSANELRSKLPYTDATILEIQRIGNVVPLALMHTTTAPTTIGGYDLPADTHIIPNLTSVLMDPEVFPDPDQFQPDRFIDAQGAFVPHPNVVPFGVGKRRCLGENLAKVELFIFFTSLLHKFEIRIPDEDDKPSTKYRLGVTLSPMPFKARFIPRH